MEVSSQRDQVLVTAERVSGEAEQPEPPADRGQYSAGASPMR